MKGRLCYVLGAAACTLMLALPLSAADQPQSKVAAKAVRAWPAEVLSGTIMMVDPSQNLLIVKGPDGVPFDMVVSRRTRIESGNQKLTLDQLQSDKDKTVSVRFIPERSGDVANSIQITG